MLHIFLMSIHFFCAAAIVALVLLQRGKGAEAGAGFGAGASGTVFGARGASTALSRATAILAAVFMITSLSLAYVGARKSSTAPASSLLEQLATPTAPAKPARGPTGASSGAAGGAGGIAGAAGGVGAAPAQPTTSAPTGAPAPDSPATNRGDDGKAPK